jgi:hypothetical protein
MTDGDHTGTDAGTTDDSTEREQTLDVSRRDLAEIGAALGERDGELFKTALRALASSQSGEIGESECVEFVAAQIYAEATSPDADRAAEYVRTFVAAYGLASLADVDDLLGREAFEAQNYAGHLAFAQRDQMEAGR